MALTKSRQTAYGLINLNFEWDHLHIEIEGDLATVSIQIGEHFIDLGGFNRVSEKPDAWTMNRVFATYYAAGGIPKNIYRIIYETLTQEINQ